MSKPLVDVVIPVYGQVHHALACIQSVLSSTNQTSFRLVVIDDGSPDPSVLEELNESARRGGFTLLRNDENIGFSATCNRGFSLNRERDVVLLNSDTVVYGDWLDRLRNIAHANPAIGTVTPITNDGSIVSYPRMLEASSTCELEIPDDLLDLLASGANSGVWVEAPTGVGFCMYLKRDLIEEVGDFDVDTFGFGYGEENDYCQRAIQHGWINALTASVFVRHVGGISFGTRKSLGIAQGVRLVEALHDGYRRSVRDFINQDPLSESRKNLDIARVRRRTQGNGLLLMTHNRGGGTERHVQELRVALEAAGTPVLLCRPDEADTSLFNIFDPMVPETPNLPPLNLSDSPKLLSERLSQLGVSRVHIHNLAGYSDLTPDYMVSALDGSGISVDVTIHDYQYWCPRIGLVGLTGVYCGEPALNSCQRCVDVLGSDWGAPTVWAWRQSYERLLRSAQTVFTPSDDTTQRVKRHIPDLAVQTRPHERIMDCADVEKSLHSTVHSKKDNQGSAVKRIGVIGAIGPHKGSTLLEETARQAFQAGLRVQFVIVGFTDRDESLSRIGNVDILGAYEDSELDSILADLDLDLIWFPAVWPETYSYTLSAALKTGLEIVAFDLGAIGERVRDLSNGTLVGLDHMLDPAAMSEILAVDASRTERRKGLNCAP